jgi:hypothetical protein
MDNNLNNQNNSEEVDLFKLFNFFESKIKSVFRLVFNLFLWIHASFIRIIRDIFLNLKIILPLLIVSIVIGFIVDSKKDKIYYSEMYVTPHFDAKYELIGSVAYYNSLIESEDLDELSSHFNISAEDSKSLINFEISIGPESKNEQILQFNSFLKGVDSTTRSKMLFKDFIEDRNLYNAGMYLITARANKIDVFKNLNDGLNSSGKKSYSSVKQAETDKMLKLEEDNLKASLIETQNLKKTYLEVLKTESEKTNLSSSLTNSLGLQIEKTETKEDKLLDKELQILNKLSGIEKERIRNNKIFDNYSIFKDKGNLENLWYKTYKILFPLLMILILIFGSIFVRFYNYVLKYKV